MSRFFIAAAAARRNDGCPAGRFRRFSRMTALVRHLSERGFTVFISSGSERTMVRELIEGTPDEWIPPDRVIGGTFSLSASGQNGRAGRSYDFAPGGDVLLEGNLNVKSQKTNKVFSIVEEIGKAPLLVFGNSSGDLSMAENAVQRGAGIIPDTANGPGVVRAPFDGAVTSVAETAHAVGPESVDREVLIHVGVDTERMALRGFILIRFQIARSEGCFPAVTAPRRLAIPPVLTRRLAFVTTKNHLRIFGRLRNYLVLRRRCAKGTR